MARKPYSTLVELKCPECGKNFIPAPQHIYNNGESTVCSYHCGLAAERRKEAEKERRRNRKKAPPPLGRDDEIRRRISEGESVDKLARVYRLTETRIKQIIKEGSPEE